MPALTASLQPPAGQVLVTQALASGVQIYDCAAKADGSGPAWIFRAPEATLVSRTGKPLGTHYAGPTWEALDGSKVVGQVKASTPSPAPATAIPWLLLSAKSNSGAGVFADVRSILRISTEDGVVPDSPCTADILGASLQVFYKATYLFYR
ncbi:DUF3455 domain-containing protein [Roseateles saccharophilus]|uniref:DUF3455 domain-containing protein n=1 Tax=Roseateles saccharophilus TaxID=304 RepID=UPI001FB2217E|nr:DUF3455 domain-containing protein [Roseateles saccharophilus]